MTNKELLDRAVWRMKIINKIRRRRVELHRLREAKKAFAQGKIIT